MFCAGQASIFPGLVFAASFWKKFGGVDSLWSLLLLRARPFHGPDTAGAQGHHRSGLQNTSGDFHD